MSAGRESSPQAAESGAGLAPVDGDIVIVSRTAGTVVTFGARQAPGTAIQFTVRRRDTAVDAVRELARTQAVDIWFEDPSGGFRLLERFRPLPPRRAGA